MRAIKKGDSPILGVVKQQLMHRLFFTQKPISLTGVAIVIAGAIIDGTQALFTLVQIRILLLRAAAIVAGMQSKGDMRCVVIDILHNSVPQILPCVDIRKMDKGNARCI